MIVVVPHTHWDREWYEPFQRFRLRLVAILDQVIDTMEREPAYRFTLDGQMAAVDDYLEVRPEARERIAALVQEGRLAVGPWQILMDEFLCSGETIIRNLELGLAGAEALGGAMSIGYLPDMFGHIAQMPQILCGFGIDRACVWRGVPFAVDTHAFTWGSPDGSSVRTEYLPGGYGNGVALFEDPAAVGERCAEFERWMSIWVRDGDPPLAMYGADHTSPVDDLAERTGGRARLATLAEALIRREADRLARVEGELRSHARANLLPGVLSARIHLKQSMSRAERIVERYAEPFAALWLPEWPDRFLDMAWRRLIESSCHDSVTGCGVDDTALQVAARMAEAEHIGQAVRDTAVLALAEQVPEGTSLTINPSPFPRNGVPALGYAVGHAIPKAVAVQNRTLDNGLLRVAVQEDGTLSLSTPDGFALRGAGRIVDGGDLGDEYNYAPPARDLLVDTPSSVWCDPTDNGLQVVRTYRWPCAGDRTRGGRTASSEEITVTMGVELREDERFVRLRVSFDNRCDDHRVRFHVPVSADCSYADGQFAVVRRGMTAEGGYGEEPIPTYPAYGFVTAGGLAVLLDHVSEYELVSGELAVTLLRSVGWLSRDEHGYRRVAAGPQLPTPTAQCRGLRDVRLALMPCAGAWHEADVVRAAEIFRHDLHVVPGAGPASDPPGPAAGLSVEGEGVAMTSLRRRSGRLELRLVALHPADTEAVVSGPFESAVRVSLDGREIDAVQVADGTVRLPLHAWEIATLRLQR